MLSANMHVGNRDAIVPLQYISMLILFRVVYMLSAEDKTIGAESCRVIVLSCKFRMSSFS
jgi:hypothetical protein